jgi:ABC-type Fe3+/spermidine/putrescine transport system ATPase subunit
MTPHLAAEGLRKAFGDKRVLDGVSVSVGSGELLALLGPSGCGKSTFLRIVAGLLPQDAGSVRIEGSDMENTPARERGVGFVFQDYALFPRMTVLENVAFGLRIRGVSESDRNRRATAMLGLVGLSEEAGRPVDQISGGQRQRVALARALAVEPKLLLLDEPLSALDVKVRERLRREIKAVQKKVGITAVVVTHDQQEAMELGDRIAVMNEGRIEQVAAPRAIYQEPATEFVARFVGDVNVLPGQMYHGFAYAGDLAIRMVGGEAPGDGDAVKVILRPEDIRIHPPGTEEAGQSHARVASVSFQGTYLRAELKTEEGYRLMALLLRSHPMADRLAEGDAVRVDALRGSVLPDPLGKREPEYYL